MSNNMNSSILEKLIAILKINPYCTFFRTLKDVATLESCKILLKCNVGFDQRVYNTPSTSEVAGIWVENNDFEDNASERKVEREICIYSHSDGSHKIQHYYGCYDPLQYPLLLPHGDIGWHQGIQRMNKRNRQNHSNTYTFMNPYALTSAMDLFDKERKGMNI